jgi:plasmid stabilization system protein ParE
MVKIIWSPRAASGLEEICDYIATDSEHYARIFAQRIIAIVEKIPDFPYIGRIVPEYQKEDLRERIFQNYRIIYRIKPEVIELVAVVHSSRLLPDL